MPVLNHQERGVRSLNAINLLVRNCVLQTCQVIYGKRQVWGKQIKRMSLTVGLRGRTTPRIQYLFFFHVSHHCHSLQWKPNEHVCAAASLGELGSQGREEKRWKGSQTEARRDDGCEKKVREEEEREREV